MGIGERIKQIRKEKGVSLRGLAAAAEISVAYLSNIEEESSSPTIDVLERIAQALEVTITEITEVTGSDAIVKLPVSLLQFIELYKETFPQLKDADWQHTLAHVRLRGRYPEKPDDWLDIFVSLRRAMETSRDSR
jgi:transcriptional regulator with XRE-family HTH domain